MSNAELKMNSEKAMLAKYILSIDNEETLAMVKKQLSVFMYINSNQKTKSPTQNLLEAIAQGWEDTKTADEMVNEIYSARSNKQEEEYSNPFEV